MDIQAIRAGLQRSAASPPPGAPKRPKRWRKIVLAVCGTLIAVPLLAVGYFRAAAIQRETQMAAELAPATGRFVATSQGRIFIQEKGAPTAAPVILIHGTAAWSELWREMIDHLAASGFRVIAVDLPPFGFSDRPADRNYTRSAQAARIAALIDALDAKQVMLVGHSFGAGPTVETVMRYPEKVGGLVLIAGALGISEPEPSAGASPIVGAVLGTDIVRNAVVATLATNPLMTRRLLSMMIYRKEAADARRTAVLQRPMTLRGTTPDLGHWLRYFVAPDTTAWSMDRGKYAAIKIKTALIWGDKDTLTPLPQGRDIQTLIAGSSLTVLPEIGHIPQVEDPAAFAPVLTNALRSVQ